MKIGLYKINEPIQLRESYKIIEIDSLDDIKIFKDVDIFVPKIVDEKLIEKISRILSLIPDTIFVPYLENKNHSIIPKIMALGAKTFILPPFNENFQRILTYLEKIKIDKDNSIKENFCGIIGKSEKMQKIFNTIKKVAPTDSVVLITGESGTGKELVAKAIHSLSQRKDKIFIPVNCGAIPKDLVESELFGYRKGAFTGANTNKTGRFEAANGGTIFLDEIGELPLELQVKILRVIQENEIQPVGAVSPIKVNVRIIAATNKNLEKLIEEKKFREDLFYRLNVIQIKLPPLRERKEDIEILIDYFLKKFTEKHKKSDKITGISDEAKFIMKNYPWPGNVRELENCIERLVVLNDGPVILPSDLPSKFFQLETDEQPEISEKDFMNNLFKLTDEGIDLKSLIDNIETSMILQALEKAGGVKDKAAKLLGIKRTTLIEKMKRKKMM